MPHARPRGLRAALTVGLVGAMVGALTAASTGGAQAAGSGAVGGVNMGSPTTVMRPGVSGPPDVATSWLVADLDSGTVLAAKAPHQRLRPASTLKTLTALTLLPLLDPTKVYTAVPDDVRADGTRVGMVEGGTYSVHDLFNALLLPSANDAAHALGEIAGGQDKAVALMRTEAQQLQARDTTPMTTSGLDADGQYSSAYDLALIARAAMARPDFRGYVKQWHANFPGLLPKPGQHRATYVIENANRLLRDHYPGIIGVKTGYTSLAGNTYIGAVTRGNRTILITMLHINGKQEDQSRALFDWAFAHLDSLRPVGTLVEPLAPPTPSASAAAKILAAGAAAPKAGGAVPSSGSGSAGMLAAGAAGLLILGGLAAAGYNRVRRRRLRTSPLGLSPLRRG